MKKQGLVLLIISFPCLAMEKESKWDAQLYDQNSKQQYEASLESIREFDLSSPEFKTIVELGCNTANISNTLAQKYPDKIIVGIDPEKDAIELASKKHKSSKNLRLICDYAQTYKLQNYEIPLANFVGCYYVLHWIERKDLPIAFKNIVSNLEKGGILNIIASAKQEDTPLTKAVIETLLSWKWSQYWATFFWRIVKGQSGLHTLLTDSELRELGVNASLEVENCSETERCFKFSSIDEFKLWLASLLKPHGIDAMTKDDQEKFVSDTTDLYVKKYNSGKDRAIEYRIKELHFTAHKICSNTTFFTRA